MTYSVWQSFITNGLTVLSGATVSVFHEGSGAPAALFSSPSGGAIGSSVTSDSAGLARFYVAAGVYRVTVTHASFSAEHRHVRIGEMAGVDDAPPDGKQYARKDGGWEEVSGSYLGDVTKSVGSGGDFADLDELQAWMNANSGRFLTVNVLGEVASPSGAIPALTNQSFLHLTLNGVSGSALNAAYFFGNVGLSGQFTVKGDLTFTSYAPSPFNVTVTLSKTVNEQVSIYNCDTSGGTIIYDGRLEITNSVFYVVRSPELRIKNANIQTIEAFDDGFSACYKAIGHNRISTIDARSKTLDYLIYDARGSATLINSVLNDGNVTDILSSGMTINTFSKNGYVTVANK